MSKGIRVVGRNQQHITLQCEECLYCFGSHCEMGISSDQKTFEHPSPSTNWVREIDGRGAHLGEFFSRCPNAGKKFEVPDEIATRIDVCL